MPGDCARIFCGKQRTHFDESVLDLERDVVGGQLVEHVLGEAVHDRLARLARPGARVLRLDAQNRPQNRRSCGRLVPGVAHGGLEKSTACASLVLNAMCVVVLIDKNCHCLAARKKN